MSKVESFAGTFLNSLEMLLNYVSATRTMHLYSSQWFTSSLALKNQAVPPACLLRSEHPSVRPFRQDIRRPYSSYLLLQPLSPAPIILEVQINPIHSTLSFTSQFKATSQSIPYLLDFPVMLDMFTVFPKLRGIPISNWCPSSYFLLM